MKLQHVLIALSLVTITFGSLTATATHDESDCVITEPPGEVIVVPTGDTGAAGDLYINDRPAEGNPTGTGLVDGGGTWIYEESNGIPGLQTHPEDDTTSNQQICGHEPDTLIF